MCDIGILQIETYEHDEVLILHFWQKLGLPIHKT